MARVVITAEVDHGGARESGFRAHGDLFQTMSTKVHYYAINEDDTIAVYAEPEDLNTFMHVLQSEDTANAMVNDGVKRDTVKVFVLDGEFRY